MAFHDDIVTIQKQVNYQWWQIPLFFFYFNGTCSHVYLFICNYYYCLLNTKKKVEYTWMRVHERERKVAEILCDNSEWLQRTMWWIRTVVFNYLHVLYSWLSFTSIPSYILFIAHTHNINNQYTQWREKFYFFRCKRNLSPIRYIYFQYPHDWWWTMTVVIPIIDRLWIDGLV